MEAKLDKIGALTEAKNNNNAEQWLPDSCPAKGWNDIINLGENCGNCLLDAGCSEGEIWWRHKSELHLQAR